jgi:ADP-ribose pyrophosphatase
LAHAGQPAPSPGISTEICRVYQAEQLNAEEQAAARPDEESELRSGWVPLPQAVSEVLTGRITNGLAVAGLLAAAAGTDAAPVWIRPADAPGQDPRSEQPAPAKMRPHDLKP